MSINLVLKSLETLGWLIFSSSMGRELKNFDLIGAVILILDRLDFIINFLAK